MINKELVISKIDRLKKSGAEVVLSQRRDLPGRAGIVVLKVGEITLLKEILHKKEVIYTLRIMNEKIHELDQKDLEHVYAIMSEGIPDILFHENHNVIDYLKS